MPRTSENSGWLSRVSLRVMMLWTTLISPAWPDCGSQQNDRTDFLVTITSWHQIDLFRRRICSASSRPLRLTVA